MDADFAPSPFFSFCAHEVDQVTNAFRSSLKAHLFVFRFHPAPAIEQCLYDGQDSVLDSTGQHKVVLASERLAEERMKRGLLIKQIKRLLGEVIACKEEMLNVAMRQKT